MGIFGESEEIKQLKEMISLQKKTNDVLIKREDLMRKELNFIQNSIIDMAKITAQHKNIIMFMLSQMEFNKNAQEQLKKLLKTINKK